MKTRTGAISARIHRPVGNGSRALGNIQRFSHGGVSRGERALLHKHRSECRGLRPGGGEMTWFLRIMHCAAGPLGSAAMPIKTRRWNDPRQPDDKFRLLICRYRPRAVRKADETWDAWFPELGPSK